jgi:hypothetical protein
MSAILKRLTLQGIELSSPGKSWDFSTIVEKKDLDFFRHVVKNHPLLQLEYSVHCAALIHDLLNKQNNDQKTKDYLIKQIETALLMAELLEYICREYLKMSHEVTQLQKEQDVYRKLLKQEGYSFSEPKPKEKPPELLLNKVIRELTFPTNMFRLFVTRARRLLVIVTPVVTNYTRYANWVNDLDHVANPILSYAAWVFFIPRLATNLYYMGKHIIPGFWMDDPERKLGWYARTIGQLERRWFELGNDSAAVTVNVLTCFLLIGGLTPVGIYLTAGLLAYDVFLASFRAYVEMSRYRKIEQDYVTMLKDNELPELEREQIQAHLQQLRVRMAFEQKRLYTQVALTCVLLLAFALTLPCFGFVPIVPIIGAALAVMTTLAFYVSMRCLEKQRPKDSVASVVSHSIFKPPSNGKNDSPPPTPSDGFTPITQ